MIDGNRLIEVLSLPSHDKRVVELLKDLGLKRPVKDENYNNVQILEEFEDGYFTFDEVPMTKKQKEGAYGNVDFYLNGITVMKSDIISPPFGIEWSDSYEEVKNILGKKADFKLDKKMQKNKEWLLEDNEKQYFFALTFDQTLNEMKSYRLESYEQGFDYKVESNEE